MSKPQTTDSCEVADSNLERAEQQILSTSTANSPTPSTPWDRVSAPAYLDRVMDRVHISRTELGMLRKNGFVVLESRPLDSYATGYHDVFQTELPVYVTADSIFHSVFASNDTVIASIESKSLAPMLFKALVAMHCALPSVADSYPPEVARDLDVYLSVALALLTGRSETQSRLGTEEQSQPLLQLSMDAEGMTEVELFGRKRMIDWSQMLPRGHYSDGASPASPNAFIPGVIGGSLTTYFRASMWLSRVEFNLVSRSCRSSHPGEQVDPRETPREDVVALALADLASRTGAASYIEQLDRAWHLFAGRREDVSIRQLNELRSKAGITSLRADGVDQRLRAAIGTGYRRTARLHFMPQGSHELPAIATLLGPRVVDDAVITRGLVHDELPGRNMVHAGDIAYALGHDRAKAYLAEDRRQFPMLDRQLEKARADMLQSPRRAEGMYGAWLGAILQVATQPSGAMPSFMDGVAFQDMRMNSALVAFGQLRHNYVLVAGQGYDSYGCEIPDGYVEPALGTYDGLLEYARRSRAAVAELDPTDASSTGAYFRRLARVLQVLRTIVIDELAGRTLSEPQKRWLAMVAEHIAAHNVDSGGPPKYTGWYFDLFVHRDHDSKTSGAFIADWYTSTNAQQVAYLGASAPRLGLFVVDVGGAARVMAGPVARGYEHAGPTSRRLDDGSAAKLGVGRAPWEQSYTARATPEPALAVRVIGTSRAGFELAAKSTRSLGPVTLELLNHRGAPIATRTQEVGTTESRFRFSLQTQAASSKSVVEGVHVRVGEFNYVLGASDYRPLQDFALGELRKEQVAGVQGGQPEL